MNKSIKGSREQEESKIAHRKNGNIAKYHVRHTTQFHNLCTKSKHKIRVLGAAKYPGGTSMVLHSTAL